MNKKIKEITVPPSFPPSNAHPISKRRILEEFIKWTAAPADCAWAKVTLLVSGQFSVHHTLLAIALENTLRMLDHWAYRNAYQRNAKKLFRLAFPGGDPKAGVFNHYHLLLQVPKHKQIGLMRQVMTEYWNRSLRRLCRKIPWYDGELRGEVWMEPFEGGPYAYIRYMSRNEAPILMFGIDKVDLRNTVLPLSS